MRRNHPNEEEREEGAGEADRRQDPVRCQVFLTHSDPPLVYPGAHPAPNVAPEVRYSGQEGKTRRLDVLRANLRHDHIHWEED